MSGLNTGIKFSSFAQSNIFTLPLRCRNHVAGSIDTNLFDNPNSCSGTQENPGTFLESKRLTISVALLRHRMWVGVAGLVSCRPGIAWNKAHTHECVLLHLYPIASHLSGKPTIRTSELRSSFIGECFDDEVIQGVFMGYNAATRAL
jgi:hypothetical protein